MYTMQVAGRGHKIQSDVIREDIERSIVYIFV